jgi:hypothetical protein
MFIENLDDFVQESAKIKERQSKVYEMEREGFKSYAGLPGEVEARNVQLRFEGDKKKTAAEYRDMPPTQTRDNQGLFFPLEESDLYKKAEGGEISNMSERKAGLADLIYKKHFSSGPLSRMQPQSFRRGGPALGGGPINRPRFNNFKEEEQYVNPAVSSYVNPADFFLRKPSRFFLRRPSRFFLRRPSDFFLRKPSRFFLRRPNFFLRRPSDFFLRRPSDFFLRRPSDFFLRRPSDFFLRKSIT